MQCELFFQQFSNSASKKSHEHQSNKDNHLDDCFDLGQNGSYKDNKDNKDNYLDDCSDVDETDNNIAEKKLRQRRTMDNSRNSPPLINIISLFIILIICIITTRPKPVRPSGIVWREVFSTSHFAPAALSSDLNQPGTINDDRNPPGILKTRPGVIKNMNNHLEP